MASWRMSSRLPLAMDELSGVLLPAHRYIHLHSARIGGGYRCSLMEAKYMRFPMILLALTGTLALAGCDSPSLLSLDPAVTDQEAVFDASLLGTWETAQGGDLCIFRHGDGNAYTVTYVSDGTSRKFEARLFQAGQTRLLDLSPLDSDDFQIPGHTLIRILASGESLRWTFLDSEWLRQQAAQELPSRARDGNKILLTAPAASLRDFLGKYATDDRAHGDVEEWRRLQ